MSELVWTTERPKVPGWYWRKFSDWDKSIKIGVREVISHNRMRIAGGWISLDAEDFAGNEWAGPIPEPRP